MNYNRPYHQSEVSCKARQAIHTKKRLSQRYGIEATKKVIREVVQKIISRHNAFLIGIETYSRAHYLVEFQDKKIYCVYDRTRKSLRTVLPYNNETVEELQKHFDSRFHKV